MAGVTGTPNRASRRAQAATAKPVVAATAALAGDAHAPGDVPPSAVVPAPPAVAAPDQGTVLPDETLVARPGEALPIVTASPPLAAEADALDVIEQQAAMVGGENPGDPRERAEPVVAGQTMLTVEGSTSTDAIDREAAARTVEALGDDVLVPPAPSVAHDVAFDAQPISVVEVVGPKQGRRRAGFAFGPTPRRFLSTTLTAEQLAAIRADTLLTVGVSTVDLGNEVEALREFGFDV